MEENVKTQQQEVMGIDGNLKGPHLYTRMPHSLWKTKSIITDCNSFHCLKSFTDEMNQRRNTVTFIVQMFKGYNCMDAGANFRQRGNHSRLAWTALHLTASPQGSCIFWEMPCRYLSSWLWFQSIVAALSIMSESFTPDSWWVITNGKLRHWNSLSLAIEKLGSGPVL